jgi:hypothetical protein
LTPALSRTFLQIRRFPAAPRILQSDAWFHFLCYIELKAALENAMPSHKFRIGQLAQRTPAISRNVPGGTFEITKQLLESGGEFEYRIKSANEPHERVARESEVRGA